MKGKMATVRTTKINRAAPSLRHDLEHYCRDLNGWPRSWMGLEKDLPPGEQLVALFRPFLEYLAASKLSAVTIKSPGRGEADSNPSCNDPPFLLLQGERGRGRHHDPITFCVSSVARSHGY